MTNWLKYGWPRRYIVLGSIWLRNHNWISEATDERINDWLYPSDLTVQFN